MIAGNTSSPNSVCIFKLSSTSRILSSDAFFGSRISKHFLGVSTPLEFIELDGENWMVYFQFELFFSRPTKIRRSSLPSASRRTWRSDRNMRPLKHAKTNRKEMELAGFIWSSRQVACNLLICCGGKIRKQATFRRFARLPRFAKVGFWQTGHDQTDQQEKIRKECVYIYIYSFCLSSSPIEERPCNQVTSITVLVALEQTRNGWNTLGRHEIILGCHLKKSPMIVLFNGSLSLSTSLKPKQKYPQNPKTQNQIVDPIQKETLVPEQTTSERLGPRKQRPLAMTCLAWHHPHQQKNMDTKTFQDWLL